MKQKDFELAADVKLAEITTVAIPLCFGDPRDPNDGCHDRFETAIKDLIPRHTLVIQTGGNDSLPLCDLMYEVLKKNRPDWTSQFLPFIIGWGTRSEIVAAFALIRLLADKRIDGERLNTQSSEFRVVISSNKAHLRRIKWYVKIHNISHLPVEYREAKHYFSFKDTLREWVGIYLIILKDKFVGVKNVHEKEMVGFWSKILSQEWLQF